MFLSLSASTRELTEGRGGDSWLLKLVVVTGCHSPSHVSLCPSPIHLSHLQNTVVQKDDNARWYETHSSFLLVFTRQNGETLLGNLGLKSVDVVKQGRHSLFLSDDSVSIW